MYSPKIDKHSPNLYRLSQAIGKPMTKVADDLIAYAFNRLDMIYEQLDQEAIANIMKMNSEHPKNT